MPEIYNLSTLCRCCHADGTFKSLKTSFCVNKVSRTYETMLEDTFGITIQPPPLDTSYTICKKCIKKLRTAYNFKKLVNLCEQKFLEYCRNEQFLNTAPEDIKGEIKIKTEKESNDQEVIENDDKTHTEQENNHNETDLKEEIKEDAENDSDIDVEHSDDVSVTEDNNDNLTSDLKEEEDPHVLENEENTTKEDQANDTLKESNKKPEKEAEEVIVDLKVDTSLIIEEETEKGTKFSCKDCEGYYKTRTQVYHHLETNHGTLKCTICGKKLKAFITYKKHIRRHYTKKYECKKCNENFQDKPALDAHMKIHAKERIYICDICKKAFASKSVLRKHLLWHYGLNKVTLCELCGQSFNDKANLRKHIQTVHEKLRPYVCKICSKTFTANKHLKEHLIKHTSPDFKFHCDLCDKKYSQSTSLKVHRLTHDNIFKCRDCSQKFEGLDKLKEHVKITHFHGTNGYPCTKCGKVLASSTTLRRHFLAQCGTIKRFFCDICEKAFSQKSAMIRHKGRIHNPSSTFAKEKTKCLKCKRSFNNIVAHMRSHDDRKFQCDMCEKNYPENKALTQHKLQVHFGRSFECELCGKKYIQKSKLNTHKLKVHINEKKQEVVKSGRKLKRVFNIAKKLDKNLPELNDDQ